MVVMAILSTVFINAPSMVGAASDTFTVQEVAGRMAEARLGGFFDDDTAAIEIASIDGNRYGGILFETVDIPRNATITNATLTLHYEGYDWNLSEPRLLVIQGLRGSPTGFSYDTLTTLGVRTRASSVVNFTDWGGSGDYTVDVTEIVSFMTDELLFGPGWNNIAFVTYCKAPVGPWPPGGEPEPYVYQISANVGPFSDDAPTLYVEWTEATASEQTYKGWDIVEAAGGELPGFIVSNSPETANSTILFPKSSLSMNDTIPFNNYTAPFLIDASNYNNQVGQVYNDTLYLVGMDTAGSGPVDVWSAPMSDLSDWTNRGEIDSSSATAQDYNAMLIDPNTGYLHYFEVTPAGCYTTNMTLSDYTIGASIQISDGSSGLGSGIDVTLDDAGGIHVAAAHSQPAATNSRVYYSYRPSGGPWDATVELQSAHSTYISAWPEILIFADYVHIWYLDGSASPYTRYVHNPIGNSSFPVYDTVVSSTGVNRGARGTAFIHEDYYNGTYNDDVAVFMTDLPAASPYEIGYVFTTQHSATNFTSSMIGSTGYCNYTSALYTPMVWDFGETQAYTASLAAANALPTSVSDPYNLGFWNTPHAAGAWRLIDLSSIPDVAAPYRVNQIKGVVGTAGFVVTPPPDDLNNTCVALILAGIESPTMQDVKDAIDQCTEPGDPGAQPGDPNEGTWDESDPWYLDRQRFKMYLLILGVGMIAGPWMWVANTRELGNVFMMLFYNLIGLALLYAVGTI